MMISFKPDVVATTLGLALALAVLSVPLASADTGVPGSGTDAGKHVRPATEKDDSSDESGEASYNIEDCQPASEGDSAEDGVDQKDLDECREQPK